MLTMFIAAFAGTLAAIVVTSLLSAALTVRARRRQRDAMMAMFHAAQADAFAAGYGDDDEGPRTDE